MKPKEFAADAVIASKRFSLPARIPLHTSDGNFAITNETRIASSGVVATESREQTAGSRAGDRERVRGRINRRQRAADRVNDEENRVLEQESARNAVRQGTAGTGAKARMLSASTANGGSLYIYSYDGRLIAEYNRLDQCVKDYIYIGSWLLAEYKPQEEEMYFYMPDQINSTRIVTDSTGTVVYSAAHDPYGGMQKTWVNTFDPTPKFSGKERDAESGLDYFGARYYDKEQYRFISVDLENIFEEALGNPQSWNYYSYCRNNPLIYIDSDGNTPVHFMWKVRIFDVPRGYLGVGHLGWGCVDSEFFLSYTKSGDLQGETRILILESTDKKWSGLEASLFNKAPNKTLLHEFLHVEQIKNYVNNKIEKLWPSWVKAGLTKEQIQVEVGKLVQKGANRSYWRMDSLFSPEHWVYEIVEWLPYGPYPGYFSF